MLVRRRRWPTPPLLLLLVVLLVRPGPRPTPAPPRRRPLLRRHPRVRGRRRRRPAGQTPTTPTHRLDQHQAPTRPRGNPKLATTSAAPRVLVGKGWVGRPVRRRHRSTTTTTTVHGSRSCGSLRTGVRVVLLLLGR